MSFRDLSLSTTASSPSTWSFSVRENQVDIVNIERTLYHVFTYYTIHSDPKEPELMSFRGFQNFCRDCGLVDSKLVLAADVQVVFTSHSSKHNRHHLTFASFLDALMAVVSKKTEKGLPAFERFLRSTVLPHASRRTERPLVTNSETEIGQLRRELGSGLQEIFVFYASGSASTRAPAVGAKPSPKLRNTMSDRMSAADLRNFALDFGLSLVDVSAVDLADCFLLELASMPDFDPAVQPGKINFDHFFACLVRLALIAFARVPVADDRKLKALFAHLWRALQDSVPRAISERRLTQTYAGNLMQGAATFASKFVARWKLEDFQDYLAPPPPVSVSAIEAVRRM